MWTGSNFLIYGGKQVIKPEQLRPLDTTSIVLPYGDESKKVPIQRYRDVLKMVTAMEDDRAAYLLLGIENQSDIHYAMPIRNMLYDAIIETLVGLVKDGLLTIAEAAKRADMTVPEFEEKTGLKA